MGGIFQPPIESRKGISTSSSRSFGVISSFFALLYYDKKSNERSCSDSSTMRGLMDGLGSFNASSSSPPPPSPSSSHYLSVFQNYPLISAILAFAIAQSIKFFLTWFKEKRWDAKRLIGSGGMPSSHSATVTALAVAIGIQDGLSSSTFATATVIASVVMYDAFGVRLHAGKQAEVLNQIVYELPEEHPLADTRPLRELLGHTPLQVTAGGILGCIVASMAHVINKLAGGA